MKTLGELLVRMSQRVITATPISSVAESMELLAKHDIGAVVVVNDAGAALGILSERDIIKAIAASGTGVLARPVSELMSKNLVSCPPSDSLLTAITDMLHHGFRHLPIVEDGALLGMVSIRDLLSAWIGKERTEHELLIGMLGEIQQETKRMKAEMMGEGPIQQPAELEIEFELELEPDPVVHKRRA